MVITGLPRISATPAEPVGLESAPEIEGIVEGMPPQEAQEPMAITAAASAAHSLTMSIAVWPPILQ